MSKVQLSGNVSGTGIFTIASPNSNTDRTLTLPDETGTLLTSGSPILSSQLPAGTVLQVVASNASGFSTTSTSYVATGLTGSITPKSSSSRIIVQVFWSPYVTGAAVELDSRLYKNGSAASLAYWFDAYNGGSNLIYTGSSMYTELPGSTSAITYATYLRTSSGATTVNTSASGQLQQMIITEIAV